MLQSIRDKTHGWIAGIIISILILSFALWGIHSYLYTSSTNEAVAKVNGVEISQPQLHMAYERLRRQVELQNANNPLVLANDAKLKDQALQALINLQVLSQDSLNQRYWVSESQVEDYLENMPDFKVNGQFSIARFNQVLNATLFSTNDFLNLVKTTLLIDQPRLGIIFTSFSLPNEVTDSIDLINQERDINYLTLPMTLFSQQSINIAPEKIQVYYNQHLNEFKQPEQVSVEYILISAKDLMGKMHPTDAELKNYYNENAESFNSPAQWKFESLLVPVANDASVDAAKAAETKAMDIYQKAHQGNLAALAQEFSLDKSNLQSHDYIALNHVPVQIQNALAAVTQPGQVAQPIKTSQGFLIIRVIDYKKSEPQSFDKVKDEVKNAFVVPKAEEQFANLREKLANVTYEHPESLKEASDELGLPIQTSVAFTKDKGGNDISSNPKIRDAAFSNDVLNLKNNSDVIPINNDSMIVLRVKTHTPASSIPLATVQAQIVEKLKASEMEDRAVKLANEIIAQLQGGANVDQIAKKYNLTWTHTGFMSRHATTVDSAILDAAFDLPKTINTKSYTVAKTPKGFAIVGLNAVKNGSLAHSEDYDAFAEQVQNTQGLLEYELYKQSVMNRAKIVKESQEINS